MPKRGPVLPRRWCASLWLCGDVFLCLLQHKFDFHFPFPLGLTQDNSSSFPLFCLFSVLFFPFIIIIFIFLKLKKLTGRTKRSLLTSSKDSSHPEIWNGTRLSSCAFTKRLDVTAKAKLFSCESSLQHSAFLFWHLFILNSIHLLLLLLLLNLLETVCFRALTLLGPFLPHLRDYQVWGCCKFNLSLLFFVDFWSEWMNEDFFISEIWVIIILMGPFHQSGLSWPPWNWCW